MEDGGGVNTYILKVDFRVSAFLERLLNGKLARIKKVVNAWFMEGWVGGPDNVITALDIPVFLVNLEYVYHGAANAFDRRRCGYGLEEAIRYSEGRGELDHMSDSIQSGDIKQVLPTDGARVK